MRGGRGGGENRLKLKDALLAAGLRPRKALGQNFLCDERALDAIAAAAELGPDDVVLEIGPGPGVLTERLAGERRRVIACEIDEEILEFARERLASASVEWVSGDAIDGRGRLGSGLDAALRRALAAPTDGRSEPRWKLVSNLPYGISVPAVLLALAFDPAPERAVVTVQREVGDRFRAEPGTKDYGAVTVVAKLMADVSVVRKLSPGSFWPSPQVHSVVLRFVPKVGDDRNLAAKRDFQLFVKACFSERRKQLAPLLQVRSGGRVPAVAISERLSEKGHEPRSRADALPPAFFVDVYRTLWEPRLCGDPDAPSI